MEEFFLCLVLYNISYFSLNMFMKTVFQLMRRVVFRKYNNNWTRNFMWRVTKSLSSHIPLLKLHVKLTAPCWVFSFVEVTPIPLLRVSLKMLIRYSNLLIKLDNISTSTNLLKYEGEIDFKCSNTYLYLN